MFAVRSSFVREVVNRRYQSVTFGHLATRLSPTCDEAACEGRCRCPVASELIKQRQSSRAVRLRLRRAGQPGQLLVKLGNAYSIGGIRDSSFPYAKAGANCRVNQAQGVRVSMMHTFDCQKDRFSRRSGCEVIADRRQTAKMVDNGQPRG